jgi:hypothetical protein
MTASGTPSPQKREEGFSLVELLIACGLVLVVLSGFLSAATPVLHLSRAAPETLDVQQRVRAGAELVWRDLYDAGAGFDSGVPLGSLSRIIAPVLPWRLGTGAAAPADVRDDVVSVIRVPATSSQTRLTGAVAGGVAEVRQDPGCPAARPACDFVTGDAAFVVDQTAHFDLFTIRQVNGQQITLEPRGAPSNYAYGADAALSRIEVRTYYFSADARQLRLFDNGVDVPVLDDVVTFRVEYFGRAEAPVEPKPPTGGTNCLYDASGARLPVTVDSGPIEDGLVAIPIRLLADGPWCGSGGTAFDADLLRVRRIRITLRVQASAPELRGGGSLYAQPGTGRSAWRNVPDAEVVFDVSPRNLGE